jgi:C-terminal processing protease CtpA/Prc
MQGVPLYAGTQKIFESRWSGGAAELGISLARSGGGWRLENRGTDPDIEVNNAPQDYAQERDPQLLRAIEVALAKLAELPAHTPSPTVRPTVAPPVLPPRARVSHRPK